LALPATGSDHQNASAPKEERFVARPVPQRRNQMVAAALVLVMASALIFVMALVMLLHYAGTHHISATL
jgi:ferric-dicitrate binding protein FerR (iron transport regulator)